MKARRVERRERDESKVAINGPCYKLKHSLTPGLLVHRSYKACFHTLSHSSSTDISQQHRCVR